MSPERMRKAYELYNAALERQPAERADLLNQADPELRREVESLLAQQGDGPLNLLASVSQLPDGRSLYASTVHGLSG